MNWARFQNPHPVKRNLAQLGDALLLQLLTNGTRILERKWFPRILSWRSFSEAGLPGRSSARGVQGDLYDDWEIEENCNTKIKKELEEDSKKKVHRKSTVIEIAIAELWLRMQDTLADSVKRTQCAAMLTIITYWILWRRLEIELEHPNDLTFGLKRTSPLWF